MRAPRAAVACSDRMEARRLAGRGAAVDSLPMLVCACCCVQSLHHGCEVNAWKLRGDPTHRCRTPPATVPPLASSTRRRCCAGGMLLARAARGQCTHAVRVACSKRMHAQPLVSSRTHWPHCAPATPPLQQRACMVTASVAAVAAALRRAPAHVGEGGECCKLSFCAQAAR